MYNETVTFYSKTPPNKKQIENFNVKHYEDNNICGDDLEVFLEIEHGVVQNFGFTGDTAIITTACASIFGESIIGCSVGEVLKMDYKTIEDLIGMSVSSRRKQASVLGVLTTRNAIHNYLEDGLQDTFDDII
ncbi:MAG: iron-sulfur cluster assembly scaffold protein [Candidatus Gracilibacteria bacterium]|nr:iron-sulfur cluster assembly scaffold protein [Candidatus Gracilibacteria bacterium]